MGYGFFYLVNIGTPFIAAAEINFIFYTCSGAIPSRSDHTLYPADSG
jgi:hypothetical protein